MDIFSYKWGLTRRVAQHFTAWHAFQASTFTFSEYIHDFFPAAGSPAGSHGRLVFVQPLVRPSQRGDSQIRRLQSHPKPAKVYIRVDRFPRDSVSNVPRLVCANMSTFTSRPGMFLTTPRNYEFNRSHIYSRTRSTLASFNASEAVASIHSIGISRGQRS